MKTQTKLFVVLFISFASCISKEKEPIVSISYAVNNINSEITKISFIVKNNDTMDYFIPFIKPAYLYSKYFDKKTLNEIEGFVDPDYLQRKSIIKRKDLMEAGVIDSFYLDDPNDTLYYYFKEPFLKKYYDSILINYENKKELHFTYTNIYAAISSGCVYIKKGETNEIVSYVTLHHQLSEDDIHVSFNFNTDSVSYYKKNFFKHIPKTIENYHLFKGQIKTDH